MHDVIVVGGGAAGLMSAGVAAARGRKVLLLERNPRVGTKLLLTGKGRCNVTNAREHGEFMRHVYGDRELADLALQQFDSSALVRYLEAHGLVVVKERGERYYPRVGGARAVVDKLLALCTEAGVEVKCSSRVNAIAARGEGWQVQVEGSEEPYVGRALVVATGGKSYPRTGSTGDGFLLAESLGLTLASLRPGLSGFTTVPPLADRDAMERLLELRHVAISLYRDGELVAQDAGDVDVRGALVGGSSVLRVSRWGIDALEEHALCELAIDYRPGLTGEQLTRRLQELQVARGDEPLQSILRALLPRGVVVRVCRHARLDPYMKGNRLTPDDSVRLSESVKGFRVKVVGHEGWARSVVTRGGVRAADLVPERLESRLHSGLFFCGEILNVDGDSGGYNLQLAFSTGWVVGQNV